MATDADMADRADGVPEAAANGDDGAAQDDYDPSAFPSSFTAAYCPIAGCADDAPFVDGRALVRHLRDAHALDIHDAAGVIPIVDRYLAAALPALARPPADEVARAAWLAEDAALRQRLQDARLAEILAMQAEERATAHRRGRHCLFCAEYCPDKYVLFAHMFRAHHFNIGQLDNLVMVEAFLDRLEATLVREKTCIYCGGRFPTLPVLRKHLKNKGHYRIHARNHVYDRHYVVNYMRSGRLYADVEESAGEDDARGGAPRAPLSRADPADGGWEDLDEPVDMRATCLLCPELCATPDACCAHMAAAHGFDLDALCRARALDDYDAIRVVNYMRACAIECRCPFCGPPAAPEAPDAAAADAPCADDTGAPATPQAAAEEVLAHVRAAHGAVLALPADALWRAGARWLFPVFEDDPLLCRLDAQRAACE